jgi:hypothetical protein
MDPLAGFAIFLLFCLAICVPAALILGQILFHVFARGRRFRIVGQVFGTLLLIVFLSWLAFVWMY